MTEQNGTKDPMMTDSARPMFPDSTQSRGHGEKQPDQVQDLFPWIGYADKARQADGSLDEFAKLYRYPQESDNSAPVDPELKLLAERRVQQFAKEFMQAWVDSGKSPQEAYDLFPPLADYLPKDETK